MPEPRSVPLLVARSLAKSFGAKALFDNVSFALYDGDRLGVIGPNGSGKSTLLRILASDEPADAGERSIRKGARLGWVPQEDRFPDDATVESVLTAAVARSIHPGEESRTDARVSEAIGRAGFPDRTARADTLSGGWRKRLAIASEIAAEPDVLLLDEPTNHLDVAGLRWLEDLLRRARFSVLFVSHDRYFLESVATRMIELNRIYPEGTLAADGPYSRFLEAREAYREGQARLQETLENRVRREVEWLRRGPKARATKAQYRVDEAHRLQDELATVASRAVVSSARFDFTGTDRRTKRLLVARGLSRTLGGRALFGDVGFVLAPGMCLGLAGPNGSGKTSLLRLLSGEDAPDAGTIETADGLRVVRFDQRREQLDPRISLRRTLAPDGDAVRYRDQSIHIVSWARRMLFDPDHLDTPVGDLSGGEKARALIARLVVQPADVLLLDEPTNDLDIPTLEVLEDTLSDFPGALVLVTHDRYLMDRLATTVLGLDGRGAAAFYGDREQWEEALLAATAPETPAARKEAPARAEKPRPRRHTYLEQKEYETIEARIEAAETTLSAREAALADPAIACDAARLQAAMTLHEQARTEVETLYARWQELEAKLQE